MTSTPSSWTSDVSRRAVSRLTDIVVAGGFERLAEVDRVTGELVQSEARALFAALPCISPATAPDELVDQGLLARLPQSLPSAYARPKYFRGREIFVKAPVSHRPRDRHRPVGEYREGAPLAFTHRGVLLGRTGDVFAVELEGAPDLLRVHASDVYAWNEPSGFLAAGGVVSGVAVDPNDPLWKAHVCASLITCARDIEELDFSRPDEEVTAHQQALVSRLSARVRMDYAGRGTGYAGPRAGALMQAGQGVCFAQSAVAGAFLQSFGRLLAFEVQLAAGRTLRLGAPHGFVVVTLRPTMQRFVCDPAWGEPLTPLRVAFFGAGWGHDRRLTGLVGAQQVVVRPTEVELPELEAV